MQRLAENEMAKIFRLNGGATDLDCLSPLFPSSDPVVKRTRTTITFTWKDGTGCAYFAPASCRTEAFVLPGWGGLNTKEEITRATSFNKQQAWKDRRNS
jgi:hypothetical protein